MLRSRSGWWIGSSLVAMAILAAALVPFRSFLARGASLAPTAPTAVLVSVHGDQFGNSFLTTIDPATGAVTKAVTPFTSTAGVSLGVSALDSINHILYVQTETNAGASVTGVNTQTGALAGSHPMIPGFGSSDFPFWELDPASGLLVSVHGDEFGNSFLTTIDPTTGAVTKALAPFITNAGVALGVSALDSVHHILYVQTETNAGASVTGVNTQNGALVSSHAMDPGFGSSDFPFWELDPASGQLVSAHGDEFGNTFLTTIDPTTGAVTKAPVPFTSSAGVSLGVSALDSVRHTLYVQTETNSGASVTGINSQDGTLASNHSMDPGFGSSDFPFWEFEGPPTPQQQLQALESQVQSLASVGTLSSGEANALEASLSAAMAKVASPSATVPKAACNDIGAFVNQVNALVRSGRLTSQQGASLTDPATAMIAQVC